MYSTRNDLFKNRSLYSLKRIENNKDKIRFKYSYVSDFRMFGSSKFMKFFSIEASYIEVGENIIALDMSLSSNECLDLDDVSPFSRVVPLLKLNKPIEEERYYISHRTSLKIFPSYLDTEFLNDFCIRFKNQFNITSDYERFHNKFGIRKLKYKVFTYNRTPTEFILQKGKISTQFSGTIYFPRLKN